MREFEIQLRSVRDVEDFIALTNTRPFPVFVSDDHCRVSGKSFTEMFCLNLSRPILLEADCSKQDFRQLRQEAARFLATE